MKRIIFAGLLAFSSITVSAQQLIHDANAEKRNVSGYHGIKISGGVDLYLSAGMESVAVSASQVKFRDQIRTEVKEGILHIWCERDRDNRAVSVEWGNHKMKAYVSYKVLDQLGASGGSDIRVEGTIQTSALSLNVSGGSDFNGAVEINDLNVDASGGSDVFISGKTNNLDVDASGGSDFKGYGLIAETCDLNCSGGSDAFVTVNKSIKAEASGGSDIFYKGGAVITQIKSSGSSDIKKVSR